MCEGFASEEEGRSERASARRDAAVDFPDMSGSILRNSRSGFSRCARHVYFRLDSPGCWDADLCRTATVGFKVVLGDKRLGMGEEEETSRDVPEVREDPAPRSCQFQLLRCSKLLPSPCPFQPKLPPEKLAKRSWVMLEPLSAKRALRRS